MAKSVRRFFFFRLSFSLLQRKKDASKASLAGTYLSSLHS